MVAGDVNDVITVATGYDYIADEAVPHGSSQWYATAGMAIVPVISGSLLRAARGADVAFGFSRNLPGFKNRLKDYNVTAMDYNDLGLDDTAPDFANKLLGVMNEAGSIHFDLSNMTGLMGKDGVLFGPKSLNPIGSTNWELRTIWDDPVLRVNTTFYRDGKEISVEDILSLTE